jgi:hypothetical protein
MVMKMAYDTESMGFSTSSIIRKSKGITLSYEFRRMPNVIAINQSIDWG